MDFLKTDAHPGDVVLTADNLIAPVLALTKCRVPIGYFAYAAVARSDYMRRETAEKQVLESLAIWEKFKRTFCGRREFATSLCSKSSDGLPADNSRHYFKRV